MTKADLIEVICDRVGSSKKEAAEIVETILVLVSECLRRGEKVKVSGFGTFAVNHKKERRGRNPQTGDPITICSRCVLTFKPSQVLKELIHNGSTPSP